ncbi:MAG: fibronectin type III domain-containing protein [Acidobacteriota bacterium]
MAITRARPAAGAFIGRFDTTAIVVSAAAPAAPTNLLATASGASVTLSWTASAGGPESYIVEAGSMAGLSDLARIDLGSTATSFSASGVPAGTYFVRVRARNAHGASEPSNEAIVTVPGGVPCTTPPGPPVNFTVSVAGNAVTFAWQVPATGGPPTSYVLEAGSSPGASGLFNSDVGGVLSFRSAAPDGNYFARARARNGCGTSGPSNEAGFAVGPGLNLSGRWSGVATPTVNGIQEFPFSVVFDFVHSGNRLTGALPPNPFGTAAFDLTETAQSPTTRTFSGSFTVVDVLFVGPCSPSIQSGIVTVTTAGSMSGTFGGRNTDCLPETNTFSLVKLP